MPCEHLQASDLIILAEKNLKQQQIPIEKWQDMRFGYWENIDAWGYQAIYTEITFRQKNWVITAINRQKDPISNEKLGFHRF